MGSLNLLRGVIFKRFQCTCNDSSRNVYVQLVCVEKGKDRIQAIGFSLKSCSCWFLQWGYHTSVATAYLQQFVTWNKQVVVLLCVLYNGPSSSVTLLKG